MVKIWVALALAAATTVSAQTFRRTAACGAGSFGCLFPPTETEFIAGQVFDIRLEVQAPINGTEAYNNGTVNPIFKLEIGGYGAELQEISAFYGVAQPTVESYAFHYYEDLAAEDAKLPTFVNVLAQTYRHITLYNPGQYTVKLSYNSGMVTYATWHVLPLAESQTAKNVILFISDGTTSSMITAARMLGHKSVNGKYLTRMAVDDAPAFGMQMTHSLDSFITDSANSATAIMSGKKATVNGLNQYTDSTGEAFNGPKFETIFEMMRRIYHAQIGIVSTAYLADATPAAVCTHTSQRGQYDTIVAQYLEGVSANYTWTKWDGPDVLFGGGGSDFLAGPWNGNKSQIAKFQAAGYKFVSDNVTLDALGTKDRALGLFHSSTMSVWLDRNVYQATALPSAVQYNGTKGNYRQPGLKAMTLKALDILHARSEAAGGVGFALMSEAASPDKQMHLFDYERALGEVLELDDTVKATLVRLKELGIENDTLVVVTADHGHGFDVYGSSDSKYAAAQVTDAARRNAVGTYQNSGLVEYQVAPGQSPQNLTQTVGPQGLGFPVQWNPRYTAAFGVAANVDHLEDFKVHNVTRIAAILKTNTSTYFANPADSANGFFVSGNLPVNTNSGVHSLTDVPVYAWGPGHEQFRGIQNSVDIAFKIAHAMNLGRQSNVTYYA